MSLQVLDAVDLEERFRTVLPMLTRQIEALNLLQKSRKLGPAAAAKVSAAPHRSAPRRSAPLWRPQEPAHAASCPLRC